MKVSNLTIDLATNNDLRHIFDQKLFRETSVDASVLNICQTHTKFTYLFILISLLMVFFFFFFLIAFRPYQLAGRI